MYFIMFPTGYGEYDPYFGFCPLTGHSLSWQNEKRPTLGPNNTMVAKIWRPEDPRSQKTGCSRDEAGSAVVVPASEASPAQVQTQHCAALPPGALVMQASHDIELGHVTSCGHTVASTSQADASYQGPCRTFNF